MIYCTVHLLNFKWFTVLYAKKKKQIYKTYEKKGMAASLSTEQMLWKYIFDVNKNTISFFF